MAIQNAINNIVLCGGVYLTDVSYPRIFGSLLPKGDNDVYTVPSGKRFWIKGVVVRNKSGGNITFKAQIKVNGVYYTVSTSSATVASNSSASVDFITEVILNAGESLSINVATNDGLNVFANGILFDDTCTFIKSNRVLGLVNGNNTIYTVPSGKNARLFSTIGIFNNSGGTRTYTIYNVPSGGSVGNSNKIQSKSVNNNFGSKVNLNGSLSEGDSIVINTDSGAGTQVAILNCLEF